MTRSDIEREYKVDANGRIKDLGKFEGEMLYVPYYWDVYLEGFADSDDGEVLGFNVLPEDRQMFPELGNRRRRVRLLLRGDGFVCEI